jgi:HEAT repeat protein
MFPKTVTLRLALGTAVAFSAIQAGAQTSPKPASAPAPPAAVAPVAPVPLPPDAVRRLKSADPVQIKSALDDARMSARGAAPAVPAIVDLLKHGLSPALTQAALETLGDTENDAGAEVLALYARHRTVALRRAAVQSLAKTHGVVAAKALRSALSDPDAAVRGLSATGLGNMNAKDAVADLFVALDHRVAEAAASIGQLCDNNECERLSGKLGSVPFDVVTGGLDQVLLRPVKDVSDETKIKIVGRVRELGTGEAHDFLKDIQTKWPARGSQRVKQAIDQAVIATSGSPGGHISGGAP